jgi:proline dehydrogenase
MLDVAAKSVFSALAASSSLKRLASRYGMRQQGFARRFVAGETVADAIDATRLIERQGLTATLDLLGESVTSTTAAAEATGGYVRLVDEIARAGVSRNISLKLTQLGLDIDRATAVDNLRRVLDVASQADVFVRIDMENSPYTDQTLDTFETVWTLGYRNAGVVIQSCLKRSEGDTRRMMALGARIRLVKGAYREPAAIAFQQKSEVDAAYRDLMRLLLAEGTYPAIATHDTVMIDAARRFATERGLGADRFEFQMLYGIRRDLQASLAADGYRMRIYVPFGTEWFPYFMRRLGERPANVGFVVRGILSESPKSPKSP